MADAESKNVTITLSLDSSKFDKSIEKSRKSLDALKDFNVSDSIIKALKDSLNQASELFKNNSNTLNKDIQKIVREYNNTLTSTISKLDEPGKAIVSMLSKTGEEIAKSSSASVSSIVDANIKELKKAYEDLNMALTNHRGYKANIDSREDIHKQLKNEGLLKQAKEEIFKNYGIKDFSDVIKNNNLLKQGIELFNNASEKFKNNILSQTKNYDNAITRKLSNGRQSFSLKNDLNNSVVRTIAHKTIVDKINREIIGSDTYKKAYDEVVKQRTIQWESEYKLFQEQIAKLKETITNLNNSLRNGTKKEEITDKKTDNKEKSSHISDSTEALKQFNSEIRITGEVCFKAVPNILGVANAIRVLTEMCNRFNGGGNTTPPHNYNNGPIQPEWNRAGSFPYTHREDGKFLNNASYKNYGPSEQAFTSLVTRSPSNLFNPEAAKNWVTLANERKQRQAKEQQYLQENQAQQKQKYEPLPKEFFSYDNWFKFYKEELALMPHKERYSEIRHAYNLLNSEQIKEARRALYGNARQGNKYETGAYWWARKNAEYEVERWTNWKKQHQDTETNSKTSSTLNNAATNLNNAANKLSDAVNKLNGQTQHNTITGFAQDSTHNNGPKAMFNGNPTKSEYTFGQSSYTTYDHIANNGSKKMPSLEEYLASKGLDKAPIGIGRQEQWLKDIEKAKAEYKAMYEEASKFKGEISKIPFNLQLFASGASDVDKATEAFKKLEQAIKAYTKAQKQYQQAVNDYTNNHTQKLLDQQLLHQEAVNNAYSSLRQAYSTAKTYDKDRANAYMYYELPDANGNKRHPILDNADERKYNNKTIELDIKERYNIDKTIEKLEALRQKIKEVEADGKQMSERRWMSSSALEQKYMSILNGYGAEQLMSAGYSTSKILSYLNERLYTDERKATHRNLKTQDTKNSLFTKYKELREKYNEIQKIAEVNGKEVSLAKYTSFFYQFKNLTEQMEALGLHTSPLKYSHRNMQSPSEYAQYLNDIGKKSKDEERLQTYKQAYDQIISKQQEMLRTGEYLNSMTVEKLTKEANAYANAYNGLATLMRGKGMQVDHLKTTPFEAYSANGGYYTVDYYNENTARANANRARENQKDYFERMLHGANYYSGSGITSYSDELSKVKALQEGNLMSWFQTGNKQSMQSFMNMTANVTKLTNEYEKLNRVLGTTSTTWDTLTKKMAHHLTWMTSGMFVGAPIMAVQQTFDTLKEIEFAMAGIQQVMPSIETDMAAAKQEARDLIGIASRYGESVGGVMESAKSIGRMYGKDIDEKGNKVAGVGATNTNIMTAQAAKMAVADAFSMEEAFRGLESAMAQWNLQTENSNELMVRTNRLLETWTITAHNGAASGRDIANAIEVAGTAAAQAGMSFEFFNALLATGVRQTARSGSEIGTAIKSMTVSLESDKARKQLEAWGIEYLEKDKEGNERVRNIEDLILDISAKVSTTDKDTHALLTALSGGRRILAAYHGNMVS